MGSTSDQPHGDKIAAALAEEGVAFEFLAKSAHKDPRGVLDYVEEKSKEPKVVFITIAGRSNALSGVVAANTMKPVLACPPFADMASYAVDIHSTLRMPSKTPVMTVVDPCNCALAAARILKN